jgi:uncharacterized membrane protein
MFGDAGSPAWEQLLLMGVNLLVFTVLMYVIFKQTSKTG